MEILVCPACHGELEEREQDQVLVCLRCGLHYPIRDGIPVMLIEEAYRPEEPSPMSDPSP
ncbi:MAG: Trm112 family protein [Actinomycetota bacterium]|nr:Trm112 family protein [Actinomycetota bacterium]